MEMVEILVAQMVTTETCMEVVVAQMAVMT